MSDPARIARHRAIEQRLASLDDAELVELLSTKPELLRRGRASLSLPGADAPVFVKLVPVSTLELEPQHRGCTKNLFGVPVCCQYRLGGFGIGVWREIEAHALANAWVLSGQCEQFPLLHGWRVVPIAHPDRTSESRTKPWSEHAAYRRRSAAMAASPSSVALFLEPFPGNLLQWIRRRPDPSTQVWETESRGLELLAFVNAQGVLHMDAHFENILTDADGRLFLADWGLALARTFDLDAEERTFVEHHENYDRCTFVTSLVHSVLAHLLPQRGWVATLKALLDGSDDRLAGIPDAGREYVVRRGPVAVEYSEFYLRLNRDNGTQYPAGALARLLDEA